MTALTIKVTKNIMNALLRTEQFDLFLVEEASVTTFNAFHIDGRIVQEFYSQEELGETENTAMPEFSSWKEIRPVCFQLIKGKRTPVSFKLVLHAASELTEKIAANPECGVAANLIRALVLNLRYDNGKVTCITGSSFTTFVMDKSVDRLWDNYVRQFLSELAIDFDEL